MVPLIRVPFCDICNADSRLEAFIASLMYNTTFEVSGTPVAPFAGRCDTTTGADVLAAGPVVKVLWKFAKAFPERSVTPLVTIRVMELEAGRPYACKVTT